MHCSNYYVLSSDAMEIMIHLPTVVFFSTGAGALLTAFRLSFANFLVVVAGDADISRGPSVEEKIDFFFFVLDLELC